MSSISFCESWTCMRKVLGSDVLLCVSLPSTKVSTAVNLTVTGEGTGDTVAGRCHDVVAVELPNVPGPVQRYVSAFAGVSASAASATSVTVSSWSAKPDG